MEFHFAVGSVAERLQERRKLIGSVYPVSSGRRTAKAPLFSFPLHRRASFTSNRCNALHTSRRTNLTQRWLRFLKRIFPHDCQLLTIRGDNLMSPAPFPRSHNNVVAHDA